MVWCEFLSCAGLLTFFAYRLCLEGVAISEKTHISEGVIGMFFLAVATSFPEIITASTAVFSLGRIGLGYGDIIGSVMVNFMILMGLDYYYGKGRILAKVSHSNRITGLFVLGVVLIVLGAAVARSLGIMPLPRIGMAGVESILIITAYFMYLRVMHRMHKEAAVSSPSKREPFWKIWSKFLMFLVVVMFLGMWMARIGEKIILVTGLSQTFTGTLLLGAATSLPEIIVSFAALKASSVDMAVGNILGSNMFDVCIIPLLDVLSESPIL
ncbi:MAG: hypothetical protein ABIH74_06340, partial [Candidatus Omnitrophota bacterium]